MTSSSYLEAFLSVYGWSVYALIFVIIFITSFFLYPLLRAIGVIIVEYLSGGYNGIGFLKQVLVTVVLVIVVLFLALVPMVEISYDKMSVRKNCGNGPSVSEINQSTRKGSEGKYFTITQTHVPILPYLAMNLGQRFNNVLYKEIPCAGDLTDWNKKMMGLSLENSPEAAQVSQEYSQFYHQCMVPVRDVVKKIRNGDYDNGQENGKVRKWFEDRFHAAVDEKFRKGMALNVNSNWSLGRDTSVKEKEENLVLYFEDSKFVYDMFFSESSPMVTDSTVSKELGTIPSTFRATTAVHGYSGKNNDGMPSCADWWKNGEGSTKPLRAKIIEGLSLDAVSKVSNQLGIKECRPNIQMYGDVYAEKLPMTADQVRACKAEITERMGSGEDAFNETLLETFQGNTVKDSPVDGSRTATLALAAAGAGVAGFLEAKFGIDLGLNLVGSVASFYGTIWMLKIMLEYLLPMVMMTVYIFWGVFMIMGEMRGGALVKGLFLLFGLTIIPGIWSIIDHLDDNLFAAMYDSVLANPFNRVLLDAATGVFYFLAPFVVFNMLGMVGFGDAARSTADTHGRANLMASSSGKGLGRGGAGFGRWMMIGRTSTKGVDAMGKPVSTFTGGHGRGALGGLRDRWNNFRNKPK